MPFMGSADLQVRIMLMSGPGGPRSMTRLAKGLAALFSGA